MASAMSAATLSAGAVDNDATGVPSPVDGTHGGQRWNVVTLLEFYGAKDREPSRRERKQTVACLPAKQLAPVELLAADVPANLRNKCWQKEKRSEDNRAQVKFACSDGSSIEAAVRRESAETQGSQIAINIAGEGAISITRQMHLIAGSTCALDASLTRPEAKSKSPATEKAK